MQWFIDKRLAVVAMGVVLLSSSAARAGEVLVSSRDTSEIYKFDLNTGVGALFIGASGNGLAGPVGMRYGPDGHLYVSNFFSNQITKHDRHTGALLGVFASGGSLNLPSDLRFGPDGNLYVANFGSSTIDRFDGQTGLPLAGDGGNPFASGGELTQGTNIKFVGNTMYVSSLDAEKVLTYDITQPVPVGEAVFASGAVFDGGEGFGPSGMVFGPGGDLYVSGVYAQKIGVFDSTGAPIRSITTPDFTFPSDMLITPDGRLLVASTGLSAVLAFDPITGQQLYVSEQNPFGFYLYDPGISIAAQLLFVAVDGDANDDTIVDIADYTIWADHYLQDVNRGAQAGDFNFDGIVDQADYTIWADNYAPMFPSLTISAVPEPSTITLAALGGALAASLGWRRHRRGAKR